jgi:hypothetical protein
MIFGFMENQALFRVRVNHPNRGPPAPACADLGDFVNGKLIVY